MINEFPKNSNHPLAQSIINLSDWVSGEEFHTEFGLRKAAWLFFARKSGKIPMHFQVGGRVFYLRKDVDVYRKRKEAELLQQ